MSIANRPAAALRDVETQGPRFRVLSPEADSSRIPQAPAVDHESPLRSFRSGQRWRYNLSGGTPARPTSRGPFDLGDSGAATSRAIPRLRASLHRIRAAKQLR